MKGYYDDKRKEAEKVENLLQDYEGTISELSHENYIMREALEKLEIYTKAGEWLSSPIVARIINEALNKLQK